MPGPGHFNTVEDWAHQSKGIGFGTSKRGNIASSKEGPGPGNYSYSNKEMS